MCTQTINTNCLYNNNKTNCLKIPRSNDACDLRSVVRLNDILLLNSQNNKLIKARNRFGSYNLRWLLLINN